MSKKQLNMLSDRISNSRAVGYIRLVQRIWVGNRVQGQRFGVQYTIVMQVGIVRDAIQLCCRGFCICVVGLLLYDYTNVDCTLDFGDIYIHFV